MGGGELGAPSGTNGGQAERSGFQPIPGRSIGKNSRKGSRGTANWAPAWPTAVAAKCVHMVKMYVKLFSVAIFSCYSYRCHFKNNILINIIRNNGKHDKRPLVQTV